jgi:hypothetical protein
MAPLGVTVTNFHRKDDALDAALDAINKKICSLITNMHHCFGYV